jgi:hypothetical protein
MCTAIQLDQAFRYEVLVPLLDGTLVISSAVADPILNLGHRFGRVRPCANTFDDVEGVVTAFIFLLSSVMLVRTSKALTGGV